MKRICMIIAFVSVFVAAGANEGGGALAGDVR